MNLSNSESEFKITRPWVVLAGRSADGRRLAKPLVDGPMSTEEIEQSLSQGRLTFEDRIWHEGEKRWTRLGDRPEFDRSRPAPAGFARMDMITAAKFFADSFSTEELLETVVQSRPLTGQPTLAEDWADTPDNRIPPEAAGGDLLIVRPQTQLRLKSIVGFLLAVSALLAAMPSFVYAGELGTAGAATASRAVSQVTIMPMKLTSAAPILVFETDASTTDSIRVRITGQTGQILKLIRYERDFEIKRTDGELPTLSLELLQLPAGEYQAEATAGGVKTRKMFFLGVHDDAFDRDLELHRKEISARQQEEKKAILYTAEQYRDLARKLVAACQKWHGNPSRFATFYADWKKQETASHSRFNQIGEAQAYPEEAARLKEAIKNLGNQAEAFSFAVGQKRSIASEPESKLAKKFATIRDSAGRLSGQPDDSSASEPRK